MKSIVRSMVDSERISNAALSQPSVHANLAGEVSAARARMRDGRRRLIVDAALEAHLRGGLDQVQDSPRPHRLQILWAKFKVNEGQLQRP